jgi:hypothetical protein
MKEAEASRNQSKIEERKQSRFSGTSGQQDCSPWKVLISTASRKQCVEGGILFQLLNQTREVRIASVTRIF